MKGSWTVEIKEVKGTEVVDEREYVLEDISRFSVDCHIAEVIDEATEGGKLVAVKAWESGEWAYGRQFPESEIVAQNF